MRQYADSAALAAYPGGSAVPSEDAEALLRTASRVVDQLLRGFVYDVDDDSLPTDVDVAQALSDATCAIVVEGYATGVFTPGATKQWDQVRVGNVSLGKASTKAGALIVAGIPIPPAALTALSGVGCVGVWVQ